MTRELDVRQRVLSYLRHQAEKDPDDLAALMERTAAECARSLDGVSETQGAFRYDDEWSIKEVLGHMLASVNGVNREIDNLMKNQPSAGGARIGFVSGADRPIGESRRALAGFWTEAARLAGSVPESGLERTLEHPMFGSLNAREWIAFQRLHAVDHIQQIETIKANPNYPKD